MSAKEAEVTAAQLAQRDAELASHTRALLKLDEMRCARGFFDSVPKAPQASL
jgi:hypothetical protein